MMTDFKLTEEMIKEIEDKVNRRINDGITISDLSVDSFTTICWIIVDILSGSVQVINPIENEDDEIDFGDIEYNDPY